jgi:hypothetical protein
MQLALLSQRFLVDTWNCIAHILEIIAAFLFKKIAFGLR